MLRPLTATENELLKDVQTNPVSNPDSPSTSDSDTDHSDYDDEVSIRIHQLPYLCQIRYTKAENQVLRRFHAFGAMQCNIEYCAE
jgi:hypothetical protein